MDLKDVVKTMLMSFNFQDIAPSNMNVIAAKDCTLIFLLLKNVKLQFMKYQLVSTLIDITLSNG